jgi:hypothetical protein
MFKINDKVVCTDDSPGMGRNCMAGRTPPIQIGHVYVVRECKPSPPHCGDAGRSLVWLTGVFLPDYSKGEEIGFYAERFRLLSEIQAENRLKLELQTMIGQQQKIEEMLGLRRLLNDVMGEPSEKPFQG